MEIEFLCSLSIHKCQNLQLRGTQGTKYYNAKSFTLIITLVLEDEAIDLILLLKVLKQSNFVLL
jgi:hypothetical protein